MTDDDRDSERQMQCTDGGAELAGPAQQGEMLMVRRGTVQAFAHRLRSLLTAAGAAADYLLQGDASAEGGRGPSVEREMLSIIAEQTDRIHALLDDFMVVVSEPVRAETNLPVDLYATARQVVRELAAEAQSMGAWLVLDAGAALPPVLGDRRALHQAVAAALRSIMHVARPGERVVVRLGMRNRGACPVVEMTVGLHSRDRDLGERAGALRADDLSLTAVRRICERHGGEMAMLRDEPGVVCTLPAAPTHLYTAAVASPHRAQPVLVGSWARA
ncbi:MAG: sensor histidine kinase [Armatimonadota bacterium]